VAKPLLRVRGLVKEFSGPPTVRAVDGVDVEVGHGSTLALVGESGSGKTTLARCVTLALRPTAGTVELEGVDPWRLPGGEVRLLRRRLGFVHQSPAAALDPTMRVHDIVAEPLRTHERRARAAISTRVQELLGLVALTPDVVDKRPHELSGGQAQRVAIARAIALDPALVVLDEPTSALDVSVQAQVLNLLADLRERLELAYLLVSHDLSVVEHFGEQVAVMYLGRIVELAPAAALFSAACHPYTVALRSATPTLAPDGRRARIVLHGDLPRPDERPAGCPFRPRCWLYEALGRPAACRDEEPTLRSVGDRQDAACHFAEEVRTREDAARRASHPAGL
jgi:oligopeptide/dipeptide ABC transporter ATP-binding protein